MTVVVVGGGPAGAAAALALARAGATPLLLEREATAAEKVCGEFLAADAVASLAALGLDVDRLGAVPIHEAVLASGRRDARIALPFAARGLPRAVLDAVLLHIAAGSGVTVRRGVTAVGAAPAAGGWRLRLSEGGALEARAVVLATGKHELRGVARGRRGGALGVKLPLEGVPIGGRIALLACAGGYAGLQPRPGGGANLCAALDPRAPGAVAAAQGASAFLAHVAGGSALAARLLRDARPVLARPLAVAGVPYGYLARGGPERLFRVGDQAAVIPSLCGDGVAMALRSGRLAAEAVLGSRAAAAHHDAWAATVGGPMRLAGWLGALLEHSPGLLVALAGLAPGAAAWAASRTRAG